MSKNGGISHVKQENNFLNMCHNTVVMQPNSNHSNKPERQHKPNRHNHNNTNNTCNK
ncbi:hypothetical protein PXD04_03100 [Methanosphaera sp. ISO3-F5]|uniref:hypothetical protein n=1 Tax=Methanosphaera sp. ISO3-F5 TaxID=1452353 RepID=UPI002B262EBC|nr:hypothetical protein [Methanosphaera sp. ISO3-F5]WQH64792.1 hypothetical protein PXD04_03100 [Methanosphaera sp. ISO3-F5]